MSPAAKSICYFGFYLYAIGIGLIAMPNFVLSTFQMPETTEVWIRVVGVLALVIGYYYHQTGSNNIHAFFKHTIPTRAFVFLTFCAFVMAGYASPYLIIFGAGDLAGAMWTWTALKNEKK